jgi:thiamine-phosphate pyrophosphorylase
VSPLSNPRGTPAQQPLLCYVTHRRSLRAATPADAQETLLRAMESAATAGIDWVQIREKDLSGRDSAALCREAVRRAENSSRASQRSTRILVNDRLDVALAERAGGVHLGENALPVQEAKRLVESFFAAPPPQGFLAGVSCHSLEAAQAAASNGADYIFFGPVFATPSKASFGAPQGLERLAQVCRALSIPVLAIGGITLENAASCIHAGAAGIAAIRMFQDAADVSRVVQTLRKSLR